MRDLPASTAGHWEQRMSEAPKDSREADQAWLHPTPDLDTVWADVFAATKRYRPHQIHLSISENVTACMRGGDLRVADVWGQFLVEDPSEVGCPYCIEWMHA